MLSPSTVAVEKLYSSKPVVMERHRLFKCYGGFGLQNYLREKVNRRCMADEVQVIKGGCPICRGDVSGDDFAKFYCKRCNILFSRPSLIVDDEAKA